MKNFIIAPVIGVLFSCYFFPFGLSFLPHSINSKILLALVGMILILYDCVRSRQIRFSHELLGGTGFAVVFSLICYIAVVVNHTVDYSYATYFISFFVWLGGAYAVCAVVRLFYGKVTFNLLTAYLAGVCVVQCVLALLIDRIHLLKVLVNTYILQGQSFLENVDRLYGIGASLDNAGVRFSIVLLMIMALLSKERAVRADVKTSVFLLICFFLIAIIGNMISRTTSVGMTLGLVYWFLSTGLFRAVIKISHLRLYFIFGGLLFIVIIVSVYLYNHDKVFHQNIRFAFEGFFNWMDTGEWRTDSTDKLNRVMWIWPSNTSAWIIGTGLFGNFIYNTDIGYCRFILYCGVVGFSMFASFFIYNSYLSYKKMPGYAGFFIALLLLSFIVWFKVATDVFLIYALFYCMDTEEDENKYLTKEYHENNLLYSCYA